jgi:hypothetical protein
MQNGMALRYIREQTPEICMEAVKQDGQALYFVKNQTLEICLFAVEQDGMALGYVDLNIKNHDICMAALRQNGCALRYIPSQESNFYRMKRLQMDNIPNFEKEVKILMQTPVQNVDYCMLASLNANFDPRYFTILNNEIIENMLQNKYCSYRNFTNIDEIEKRTYQLYKGEKIIIEMLIDGVLWIDLSHNRVMPNVIR